MSIPRFTISVVIRYWVFPDLKLFRILFRIVEWRNWGRNGQRIWLSHLTVKEINPKILHIILFRLLSWFGWWKESTLFLSTRRTFSPVLSLIQHFEYNFTNKIQNVLACFHLVHKDQSNWLLPNMIQFVLMLYILYFITSLLSYTNEIKKFANLLMLTTQMNILGN